MSDAREMLFELAASYALGATTPEESAAIQAAMVDWPELAAEVASFREVAAELAQVAQVARPSPVVPSADVRDRLLDASRAVDAPTTRPSSAKRAATWMPFVLAASIAGIVALASGVVVERAELAATRAKLEHRETTLNTLLHAEKDLRVVHLKASDTVNGPGIQFFWNEKHRSGVAHAFRLTPAPANHAYQLWVIRDGKPESVKVFQSDPDGHAMVENLALPPTSTGVTAVLLTLEPAGGSVAPTTEPILRGAVTASY